MALPPLANRPGSQRVAERRLKATALFDHSTVAPRRRIVCSPASVGSSPRLPSLSRSARQRENVQTPRANRPGSQRMAKHKSTDFLQSASVGRGAADWTGTVRGPGGISRCAHRGRSFPACGRRKKQL